MGNMEEKLLCKSLRKEFSSSGFALLIYYFIFCFCVIGTAVVQILMEVLSHRGEDDLSGVLNDAFLNEILSNGWGYILACVIGMVLILLWKKRVFFREIFHGAKKMKANTLAAFLCLIVGGQVVFQVIAFVVERILNLFGLSAISSVESASANADTFSMFLYACIIAPVFEEIAFRGVLLGSMRRHGKRFAILASAFLFGMYHENIVQTPYAFIMGLILGYVTVEYSLGWAVVLHLFNNLVLGDLLYRLLGLLPDGMENVLFFALIWGCAAVSAIIMFIKRLEIVTYFRENKYLPMRRKSFFTCAGVVTATLVLAASMLFGIV